MEWSGAAAAGKRAVWSARESGGVCARRRPELWVLGTACELPWGREAERRLPLAGGGKSVDATGERPAPRRVMSQPGGAPIAVALRPGAGEAVPRPRAGERASGAVDTGTPVRLGDSECGVGEASTRRAGGSGDVGGVPWPIGSGAWIAGNLPSSH